MHHPASNPAHDSEKNQRDLDFSSFETILGLMKNLSRNNLESLIEVGFEQIHEEDRLAIEAGKPPKRDSLYEITKDLARQVKRRVSENDVLPEGWSLLDEYAVWFDEDLDDDEDNSSDSSDGSSSEGGDFEPVDPKDLCPGCGAISGEDGGNLCFGCEFEKDPDSADAHASASNVLGSENYHRSSAVDYRSWWVNATETQQKARISRTTESPLLVPCFLCDKTLPVDERCEECHRDAAELEIVRRRLEKLNPE